MVIIPKVVIYLAVFFTYIQMNSGVNNAIYMVIPLYRVKIPEFIFAEDKPRIPPLQP